MSANIHIDEGTHRSADYPVSDGFHSEKNAGGNDVTVAAIEYQ
jgi:hypothetical protein